MKEKKKVRKEERKKERKEIRRKTRSKMQINYTYKLLKVRIIW